MSRPFAWIAALSVLVPACADSSSDTPDEGSDSSDGLGSGDTQPAVDDDDDGTGSVDPDTTANDDGTDDGLPSDSSDDGSADDTGEPDSTLTPGCGMTPTAVLDGTIDVDGVTRNYIIELPANYDPNTPYPLAFGFHGSYDSAMGARMGYRLSDHFEGQAIVVYPDGLVQPYGATGWNFDPDEEDFAFFTALYEELGYELCFDTERTLVFGYSAGGYMANYLACFRGDLVGAVGAISAGGPSSADTCLDETIAFLAHGETDQTVPYNQGTAMRNVWLNKNGCGAATGAGPRPECTAYTECPGEAPVVWCSYDAAHMFFGWTAQAAVDLFMAAE